MPKILNYDCETHLITPDNPTPPMVCGQFFTPSKQAILLKEPALDALEQSLDADFSIVGHHIAFDFSVAINERPRLLPKIFKAYKEGRVFCTMTRQRLLNIREGSIDYTRVGRKIMKADYRLGALAQIYLGRAPDKSVDGPRMRFHEVDGVPVEHWPQEFKDYANADVGDGDGVFRAQCKQVQRPDLRVSPDEVHQTEAAWALHLESVEGIAVDGKMLGEVEDALQARRKDMQPKLVAHSLLKLKTKTKPQNGYSATKKVVQKFVKKAFPEGAPLTKPSATFPKGQIKTDGDTLEKAALRLAPDDKEHPLIVYRNYKKDEKTLGYVKTLKPGTVHRLHSRPNALVATGRTSWAQPNLQQLPRVAGLRECIVAPPRYVIAGCDYDSLELRSLAQCLLQLTGDSLLARKYQEDPYFDPHTHLASQILGISYEEGLARKKAGDKELKDCRQMAKAANFGYPGGMGVDKFMLYAFQSYGVVLTYDQAFKLREDWFTANPEMKQYFKIINSMKGGSLVQLVSNRVRGNVGFCDGANSLFQGLAADGAKRALVLITRACYLDESSPLYGSRPVVFVHDENILYVPEDRAAAAGAELQRLMIKGMQQYIKDVPITCETALSRRWSKDAKSIYNEAGELQIYEEAA